MHRWQYFYNTSVLRTLGHPEEDEPVEHKEELVAILEAFGQALLQSDVNIFRQSLQSLEQLNIRWRLYQRAVFKVHLLERFLMALFTVLFQQWVSIFFLLILTYINNIFIYALFNLQIPQFVGRRDSCGYSQFSIC